MKIAKKSGFTLIELMVAVAIAAILAAIVVVNIGRNADRDVRLERDRFTIFLESVKNKALAGDIAPVSNFRNCGFGIYQDPVVATEVKIYVIQVGLNENCAAVSHGSPRAPLSNPLASPTGETFDLGKNTKFSNSNFGDIFFLIPNGDFYYNDGTGQSASPIYVEDTDGTVQSPAISINSAGMIQ